jgi:uncharacterized flavoprotein (TIGR03862 family)
MTTATPSLLQMPVAIVGAGPAGLMAAEVLSAAGVAVHVFDAMPSAGRKFLLAGRGGLNLTHSEGLERPDAFAGRFGAAQTALAPMLHAFGAPQLREWAAGLGVETFVGSSGRIFPTSMKASPLLRAWLQRLHQPIAPAPVATALSAVVAVPVQFHLRHRWVGWADEQTWLFDSPAGRVQVQAKAVLLALGGGSWARLGSDGAWVQALAERGVPLAPLQPANCGFDVLTPWSEHFVSRFAGHPLKSVALTVRDANESLTDKPQFQRRGEFVATATGLEGSLIYAASALLRDQVTAQGQATLWLDLLPDHSPERVLAEVAHPRGSRSLSSHLKSRLGLEGIKASLLFELLSTAQLQSPVDLAVAIKALPIRLGRPRPLDEAISSAGGVRFDALNDQLMLKALSSATSSVFCAGEMLDWEAPTGGYLLSASMASGRWAAQGMLQRLAQTGN